LQIPIADGKQGPAAMTKKKQAHFDQIEAERGLHYSQEVKKFLKEEHIKMLKPSATLIIYI
jgi:hypothetical protein